jgi:hypothetical protein
MSASTSKRLDRRYGTPVFEILIGDHRFQSINWSLGGLLLDGFWTDASPGDRVLGILKLRGLAEVLEFRGSIARVDLAGYTAIRFNNIGAPGMDFLDRALARRLR